MTLKTEVRSRNNRVRTTAALDFLPAFVYNMRAIKGKDKPIILDCNYTLRALDTMNTDYSLKRSYIKDLRKKCFSDGYFTCEKSVQRFASDAKIVESIAAWTGGCCHE